MNTYEDTPSAHGSFAPWAALIATQLLFGGLPASSKIALGETSPFSLVLLRSLSASLFLGVVLGFGKMLQQPRHDATRLFKYLGWMLGTHISSQMWLRILCLAVLGISLNQVILFFSLKNTSSVAVSILSPNISLMCLFFSIMLKKEQFSFGKAFSVALGFAGVLLLFWPQLNVFFGLGDTASKKALFGNMLCLLSTTLYALYIVASTNVLKEMGSLEFSFRLFCCGTFVNLLLFKIFESHWPWQAIYPAAGTHFSNEFWYAISYLIFGGTISPYWLNAYASSRIVPGVVGGFVCLQPVVGILISRYLVNETIPISYFFAMFLVTSGVALLWWSNLKSVKLPAKS